MSPPPVYVRAAGMACPLGLSWPAACAAMRAGISRKKITRYRDPDGNELVASQLDDDFYKEISPDERSIFLLAFALRDLLRSKLVPALEKIPLFLALPPAASGRPMSPAVVAEELSRLDVRLAPDKIRIFGEGACGSYRALQEASAHVRRGQSCVVAAAESMMQARTLLRLAEKQRLLVEGNADGLIPGEAAAAVLLGDSAQNVLGAVRGIGFADELSLHDNDVPLRADGLVAAAQAALIEAGLELHELDFRISGASGESFYFKEQALFIARSLREPKAEFPLWLPAEALGDTGAAAGLCGILWGLAGWARKYAPGPRAIAFAGNDQGGRAAVIIERVERAHG